MNFKIPNFISEYFKDLSKEEKAEAIARYKNWHSHDFTQMFIQHMERNRELLIKEDESKTDFLSWFQFSYKKAYNRAKRALLRELITKLDYKV